MKDKVLKIISEISEVPVEEIKMDSNLVNDLGLESLDLVSLVAQAEKEFNIEIPDKELKKIQTVGDIVNYIDEK